jgi:hypothetical protein
MTVGKLKQLLEGLDENMKVYIPVSQEFDGHFYSPCEQDSGESEVGGDETMSEEDFEAAVNLGTLKSEKVFLLLPCAFDEEIDHSHELN